MKYPWNTLKIPLKITQNTFNLPWNFLGTPLKLPWNTIKRGFKFSCYTSKTSLTQPLIFKYPQNTKTTFKGTSNLLKINFKQSWNIMRALKNTMKLPWNILKTLFNLSCNTLQTFIKQQFPWKFHETPIKVPQNTLQSLLKHHKTFFATSLEHHGNFI